MIEQKEIDRVKLTPIEEVAERLGLDVCRHKCHCAFHDDSRPSLTFNTYKNRYRCYVCDAHGGVIDLVMHIRHCDFKSACHWLGAMETISMVSPVSWVSKEKKDMPDTCDNERSNSKRGRQTVYPPDLEYLSTLVKHKVLNEQARKFLYEERKIDPRVVAWCGLTSISQDTPCWKYGKPFYDAPSLLIPYYDQDGRLMSVQSRYLGNTRDTRDNAQREIPRFRFPRNSNCHIYNLQILRLLQHGEPLFITEGCSDCWAMLSAGHKSIAIPSATLLKDKDIEPLQGLNLHMFPDQDPSGERLYELLCQKLGVITRHALPEGCKDFGDYWKIIKQTL